jgi:hypothetical protein
LFDQQTPAVNPFSLFALDSDSVIAQSDPDFRGRERDIPTDAWDAFAANQYDQQDLLNGSFATFRGYYAANVPQLPKRLRCLASWIADVANQPAAVWWAVRQEFLHPDILKRMEQELERRHDEFGPALASAWHYLLEARSHSRDDSKRDWFGLKRDIDRGGWNAAVLRRFSAITRPYLKVGPALTYRAAPPAKDEECHLRDLVRLEVECPVPPHDADIPDAWLASVISEQRKNIELALQISEEVDDMHRFHISPIEPDSRPDISDYGRTHGISGCVAMFASLFDRLIALNVRMAKKEYASWPTGDDTVFARLRIWASGKQQLTTPHAFAQVVLQVSDDVFWSSDHQRDLLIVLARRWGEFSTQDKKRVENRLLVGPKQWEGQDDAVYKKYRAWSVLNRLQWLADNQCEFTFDFAKEMEKHRAVAPDWRPEYADRAAESREPRGGFVTTITDHDALLHGPIGEVLSTAQALSGRSHDNRLEESDPFAGLCLERPKRAYLSLAHAARKAEYPEWAWNTFLYSPALKKDEPRCSAVIAARICRLPDSALQVLFYPTTMWLKGVSKSLPKECPETFWKLVSRLIDVLSKVPACGRSAISGERRNWVDRAINSPPGHLAQAILQSSDHEPIDTSIKSSAAWLGNIERLLSLTGDPRRFAIAVVAHHLDWLHRRVPDWTERHLLAILEGDDHQDREALLAGFLWNPRVSSSDLYLRLKPSIFALVKERGEVQESHLPTLASFLLKGWIESAENKDARLMSNDEFRELLLHGGNSFRSHVIWHFQDGLDTPEDSERRTWSTRANLFLREVWPRQKAVKNAEMTISLCELLLASNESFPMLVDCVLPLLAKLTRNNTFRWHWRNESIDLINTHPRLVLRMLDIILPDDVSEWPFGIAEALDKIGEADHTLTSDPLWQHLMRKWKSR